MAEKVRVGIIGCGGIANGKHMPSLHKIEQVEMVAFCDLIEERANLAAARYGSRDAKVYTNYKKLLEDKSIDVVHVCTPNRSHGFITVHSLEAGKHVMCEKPMAKTYADAKKMLEASERTGKKLTIGYQQRWRGDSLYLKEACDNGELGDIYYATSPDLVHWGRHRFVFGPRGGWQSTKVGAGPAPIETDEGWLLIYHGVRTSCSGYVYSVGAAILDLEKPWHVRYRTRSYLLAPTEPYERVGDVPSVVFPCAAIIDENKRVTLYYGAADTVLAVAYANLDDIIAFTKENSF